MSFSDNQNLESPPEGQGDWDSSLNSNFAILERGYHAKLTAGEGINSGHLLWVASGGIVFHYNPNSLDLRYPAAMSYKAVSSGESDYFLLRGIVTSLDVISGSINAGEPFYASVSTPGFPVASYAAAAFAGGWALNGTGLIFNPGNEYHREEITSVSSLGLLAVGSTHAFAIDIGHRGIVKKVEVSQESSDLWTLKFYSGSAAVNSERLFETLSGGFNSFYMLDAAPWPYENTDTSSPGLIFGRLDVTSNSVLSGHHNVTVVAERFR